MIGGGLGELLDSPRLFVIRVSSSDGDTRGRVLRDKQPPVSHDVIGVLAEFREIAGKGWTGGKGVSLGVHPPSLAVLANQRFQHALGYFCYRHTLNTVLPVMPIPNIPIPDDFYPYALTGWMCPVCNRGLNPNIEVCPCVEGQPAPFHPPYSPASDQGAVEVSPFCVNEADPSVILTKADVRKAQFIEQATAARNIPNRPQDTLEPQAEEESDEEWLAKVTGELYKKKPKPKLTPCQGFTNEGTSVELSDEEIEDEYKADPRYAEPVTPTPEQVARHYEETGTEPKHTFPNPGFSERPTD